MLKNKLEVSVARFTLLLGPPLSDSSRYKIVILVGMSGPNLASQADVLGVDPSGWAEKNQQIALYKPCVVAQLPQISLSGMGIITGVRSFRYRVV